MKLETMKEIQLVKIWRTFWVSESIILSKKFNSNQIKNNQIVNETIYSTNKLTNVVIKKEIPENENPYQILQKKSLILVTQKKLNDS